MKRLCCRLVLIAAVTVVGFAAGGSSPAAATDLNCRAVKAKLEKVLRVRLIDDGRPEMSGLDNAKEEQCDYVMKGVPVVVQFYQATASDAAAFAEDWPIQLGALSGGLGGLEPTPVRGATDRAVIGVNANSAFFNVGLLYTTSPTSWAQILLRATDGKGAKAVAFAPKLLAMKRPL